MAEFEQLYQEIILDHYRNPRNQCGGDLPDEACVTHENPLCGDELSLSVELDSEDRIADICFRARGCSISLSSASMMTEAVKGLRKSEALEYVERMRRIMHGEQQADESLGDAEALQGVSKYPVRIKCAMLAWLALDDALGTARKKSEVSHEH